MVLARCGFLDGDSDSICMEMIFWGPSAEVAVRFRLNLSFLGPTRLRHSLGLFNLVWYRYFRHLFHTHGILGTYSNESSFDTLD